MCLDCLVEGLQVYLHQDPTVYISIARESYESHSPGDLFIGRCNDPDIIIQEDIYTSPHLRDKELDSIDLSPRDLETNLYHIPINRIPEMVLTYQEVFDIKKERGYGTWFQRLIGQIGDVLSEKGIPLKQDDRSSFATSFPIHISTVRIQEDGMYDVQFSFEEEGGTIISGRSRIDPNDARTLDHLLDHAYDKESF